MEGGHKYDAPEPPEETSSKGISYAVLGILVVIIVAMYAIATPFYGRMRAAAGVFTDPKQIARYGEIGPDELARMGASSRPIWLAVIGGVGLLVIIWLMVLKPV